MALNRRDRAPSVPWDGLSNAGDMRLSSALDAADVMFRDGLILGVARGRCILGQNEVVGAGGDRHCGGHGREDPWRILIYGVTGSGKTTLARQVAEITGLPWHSVDDEIGWLPNWSERPRDEQRDLALRIASGGKWVLDSAYGHWRDVILARTELIVALDYPRQLSLAWLLGRTARRIVTGELACNGNKESLRQVVSSDSIIAWHFRSFSRKRQQIVAWQADPTAPPVVRLRTPRLTEEWLSALRIRHRAPAPDSGPPQLNDRGGSSGQRYLGRSGGDQPERSACIE
jgi:adenylate kinase family enzyme